MHICSYCFGQNRSCSRFRAPYGLRWVFIT